MQKTQDQKEVSGGNAVVVSIHDVSPATCERTQLILADLKSAGVGRVSLLVVPDHHHRGRVDQDPEFARWLAGACAEGHEAVLHGYYHLRENRSSDGPVKRLVARCYTAGEGEFLDLAKQPARELLDRGKSAVEACGVRVRGFIAPAWLLGPEAEEAVREAGFGYTTRIATLSDFSSGRTHQSRSQVWSVRAGWRRNCSLVWNAVLFRRTRHVPLTRIGIHPPDWDHPKIRRQILQIVRASGSGRTPMTYDGWLRSRRG